MNKIDVVYRRRFSHNLAQGGQLRKLWGHILTSKYLGGPQKKKDKVNKIKNCSLFI